MTEAALSATISNKDKGIAHKHGWVPADKKTADDTNVKVKRKIGQSGKTDKQGAATVLWYHHPTMGTRIIDHEGIHAPITHAEWMHQEGISNRQFDRLPRGRFHIRPHKIDEYLHTGHHTPDSVYKHVGRTYKIGHKFFGDQHHIHHVGD